MSRAAAEGASVGGGDRHALIYELDGDRYGILLPLVERVVHAVELTALPGAPDAVVGAIDLHGRVMVAVDMRRKFGLPRRPLRPSDRLVVANGSLRDVALVVDDVRGVVPLPAGDLVPARTLVEGAAPLEGLARLDGDLVLIHDLDRFLALEQDTRPDRRDEP